MRKWLAGITVAALLGFAGAAWGQEMDPLLKLLVDNRIITMEQAQQVQEQYNRQKAGQPVAGPQGGITKDDVRTVAQEEIAKAKPNLGDLGGLKIGGTYFLSYQNGVTFNGSSLSDDKTDNYSKFILKRGYLDIQKSFTPWLSTRFTPDLYQDSTSGQFNLRVKYLYADFKWKGGDFIAKPDLEVGMVHTPWIDFQEGLWPWRMQDTLFIERAGITSSADLGMTLGGLFGGELPKSYQDEVSNKWAGRYGSFQLGIYNGGGYSTSEKNANKPIALRVSVRPMPDILPGLQLSAFGLEGKGNVADTYFTKDGPFKGKEIYPDFKIFEGQISYQHKYFSLGAEYYDGRGNAAGTAYYTDKDYVEGKVSQGLIFQARYQSGYSFDAMVRFPESRKWALIGRMDYFDPDTKGVYLQSNAPYTNRDVQRRYIAGIAYYLFKDNIILFDYDVLQHSKYFKNVTTANPAGSNERIPDEGRFQVTLQIKF